MSEELFSPWKKMNELSSDYFLIQSSGWRNPRIAEDPARGLWLRCGQLNTFHLQSASTKYRRILCVIWRDICRPFWTSCRIYTNWSKHGRKLRLFVEQGHHQPVVRWNQRFRVWPGPQPKGSGALHPGMTVIKNGRISPYYPVQYYPISKSYQGTFCEVTHTF